MKRVFLLSLALFCLAWPASSFCDDDMAPLPIKQENTYNRAPQAPDTLPLIEFYNDGVTPVVYVDVVPSSSNVLVFIINLDTMEEFYDVAAAGETVVDIDITGTSIRAIKNSRFWRDDAFLLKDEEGETINLLQYFTEKYLKGEELEDFCVEKDEKKILVRDDAINIIASELYGDNADLLYDPSLLLEKVHVYWLTEMLLSICEKFSNCFSDKSSVIILDNSPGFVGIGKAVHDILINKGPEDGKFLTVSSLDEQDLESSLKAIYAIHGDYQKKLMSILEPDSKEADNCFYSEVKLSGDTEYIYYKTAKKEEELPYYQGLVINKVTKKITEGRGSYNFESLLTPQITPVYNALTKDGVTSRMVPFDNVLLTQFYGFLVQKQAPIKTNLTLLKNRLQIIDRQVNRIEALTSSKMPLDLMRLCNGLDKSLDTLKGALISSGYEIMASKFNVEWSPITPLRRLLDVLKRVGFASKTKELYFPKHSRMKKEMDYFSFFINDIQRFSSQGEEFVWFGGALASVVCEMSLCYSDTSDLHGRHSRQGLDTDSVAMDRLVVHLTGGFYEWMKAIEKCYSADGDRYLASFILNDKAAHCDDILRTIIDDGEFVSAIKVAISHLMDVVADIRLLVSVIRNVTVNNDGSFTKDVDFVTFLDRKIVSKEYDYFMAKERLLIDLRDSDYMASFREVLTRIIGNWGL